MRKSSSMSTQLICKPKLGRPSSIEKLLAPLPSSTKQNEANTINQQMIRIRSTHRLLTRHPSATSIQQKKQYVQPNKWLVRAKVSTQEEIPSNKQIPKIFKRRRSIYPQSEKQIAIEDIKPIARRNNETLKESKIERKLIIRNPFEKREQEIQGIQFLQFQKCDQSAIAHRSEISEDVSEINSIVKTIDSQSPF